MADGGGGALELGGGADFSGLDASPAEIGALLDAVSEADAEEWAEQIASLDADELAGLQADGMLNEGEFNEWMDGLDDREFARVSSQAAAEGAGSYVDYLHFAHDIDRTLATQAQLEQIRQREDAADAERRTAPRHRRPTAEVSLANALERVAAGTYTYGGTPAVGLAGESAEDLLGLPGATEREVDAEIRYQLFGGVPPKLAYTQPLPPVSGLAAAIGLR